MPSPLPLTRPASRHSGRGLRELGYHGGANNIVIEWRFADGKLDRLPALAAELARLKVDVIVTAGPTATRAAKEATSSIPIVMAVDDDPVGSGFVASLAQPGANITGLSGPFPGNKRKTTRAVEGDRSETRPVWRSLGTSTRPGNAHMLKETELAARASKVQLQYLDVPGPNDIETAFRAASKGRADAVLVLRSPAFLAQRMQIAEIAVKSRLPAVYP